MPRTRTACLQLDQLQELVTERVSEAEESAIIQHLTTCRTCQRALERVTAGGSVWDNLHRFFAQSDAGVASQDMLSESQFEQIVEYLGPTDRPDMIGRVGTYEVCGFIGHGSTGVVVKAFEPRLNRYVAIKVLSPSLANNGPARQRFERESRAVAAVCQEHVVPIFAVDEFRGLPYIVMQFVGGGSLQQRIDNCGPLSAVEVVRIGRQVASGLAAAHAQGIVHRDVKPANVMLETGVDRALVTDFGMARVTDEASMTRSGVISGTPQFMSPEQAKGELVDHRSDLFSLGSLMYAASTGRPPFRAETVYGIIQRVCEADIRPVREFNPEIPEWLQAFVGKLCCKDKDDRFDTAEQVSELLSSELAYMQSPTAVTKPAREWQPKPAASRGKPCAFVLVALLALVTGGIGFSQLIGDGDGPDNVVENRDSSDVTSESGVTKQLDRITWNGLQRSVFENTIVRSFPVKPDQLLTLQADRGNVEVASKNAKEVTIEVVRRVIADDQALVDELLKDHKLKFTPSDQGLTVTSKLDQSEQQSKSPNRIRGVHFRVTVPHQQKLALTTSGNVDVKGVAGSANIKTQGGNVHVGDVGPVKIHTGGGNITAKSVNGSAELETAGGNVHVGGVAGDASAITAGGNISLGEVQGAVKAVTSGGNIGAAIAKQPTEDCLLKTTGGHVTIRIKEGLACELDAIAEGGFVQSPFSKTTNKPGQTLTKALNGGGPVLKARSGGGHVSIRYLKERAKRDSNSSSDEPEKNSSVLNDKNLQTAVRVIASNNGVEEFLSPKLADHITSEGTAGLGEVANELLAHDGKTKARIILRAEDGLLEIVDGEVASDE